MIKLTLLSLCITFSIAQTAQAEIYKWTDANGKVHYSATPPKDTSTKAENIEDKIKFNIGKVQPSKAHHTKPKTTTKEKKDIKASREKYKKDRSQARVGYCNGLRRNIQTLENSKNVNITEKENLKPLSISEKAARLSKEKSNLDKNCEGM